MQSNSRPSIPWIAFQNIKNVQFHAVSSVKLGHTQLPPPKFSLISETEL